MKHNGKKDRVGVMVVLGTRPEAIKMAPIIREFRARSDECNLKVVNTAQHRGLVDQALSIFSLQADVDLDLMEENQTLAQVFSKGVAAFEKVLVSDKPDVMVVEGDTSTVFLTSLLAFYNKVDIAHVEAGLRTSDLYNPFPEEANRRITSVITNIHFAPTSWAKANLVREGHSEDRIYVTGNPVVDAFLDALQLKPDTDYRSLISMDPDTTSRMILVTAHRRENHGRPLEKICDAINQLHDRHEDLFFVYPVHPNPEIRNTVQHLLSNKERIRLVPPMDYVSFVHLMNESYLILTDSGGIQEEAPSISKPTLILRKTTERPEALDSGTAKLIGIETKNIVQEVTSLLSDERKYKSMIGRENPFGDGKAARRIVDITLERYR